MRSTLQITAGYKNRRTYLKESFCSQPFKLCNITEDRTKSLMRLMIMSSSSGVLDNDNFEINIEVDEEAKLQLSTQAYQRLFSMQNGARQTINIYLKNNATFCYLPHPCVPHKASVYYGINNIYLCNNHCMLWSDIVTCGRKLCNEEFEFTCFQNVTSVFIEGKLVIKEKIFLEPLKRSISVIGQMEQFTHQSSLLYLNNKMKIECFMQECSELLSAIEGIEFGISELPVKGFMVRMLGHKGEQLFDLHNRLASIITEKLEVKSNLVAT